MIASDGHQPDPRVIAENIPASLKAVPRWACWRFVPDKDGGKPTKLPYDTHTGEPASSTNPETWTTFDDAMACLSRHDHLAGLMFALDDELELIGVDLDGCFDADGIMTPEAKELIETLDTYSETSPSGTGVKLLLHAKKPGGRCRVKSVFGCHEVEIYSRARFFTITGLRLDWVSAEIEDRQVEFDDLYATAFPEKPKPLAPRATHGAGFSGDDAALVQRARDAGNGGKFTRLYDAGDVAEYGGDDSAADLALVSMIAFWTGPDADRIDRIFRGSQLCREKWDRADYRERTIKAALDGMTQFYGQSPVRLGTDGTTLPEILLNTEQSRVGDEVVFLLTKDKAVYRRGGKLVRVVMLDEVDPPRLAIVEIARPWLREWITSNSQLLKETKDGEKPAHPPNYLTENILARLTWPGIPPLIGTSTSPLLRPDGTLHQVAGYDAATRMIYAPTASFPVIPEDVTLDDASGALEVLLEPFADFPFASEADRSAYLAGILTLVGRTAFTGPAPLFLVTANIAGAGKSLLAQCAAEIALGRPVPTSTFCNDSEECRKQITTLAKLAEPVVILDNLQGTLGNAALDRALTSTFWRDRELRTNDEISAPLSICWWATGNNTDLAADTHRRVIVCRLDLLTERPEDRDGFKHPNLLAHVRANRTRLFVAAMTIVAAYIRAGRPPQGLKPFGSFEGWNDLIASALVWLGMPNPRQTQHEIGVATNPVHEALSAILPALAAHPKTTDGFVASNVLDWMYRDDDEQTRSVRQAIEALAGGSAQKSVQPRDLGKRLRSVKRRVVDGLYLDHAGESRSKAGTRWVVRRVEGKS